MKRTISLHPNFAAAIELVIGGFLAWWLLTVSVASILLPWLFVRLLLTATLSATVFCPAKVSRVRLFLEFIFLQLGVASLTIFIDNRSLASLVAGAGLVLASAIFWLSPKTDAELGFAFKPARRARLMSGLVGMAGFLTALYASSVFQIINFWQSIFLWIVFVAMVVAESVLWWKEYGIESWRDLAVGALLVATLVGEASFFVWWLPIGYLAAGFLVAWWWYFWWLLLRFVLSSEGIDWVRQRPFLVGNALAVLIYLFFVVRWK